MDSIGERIQIERYTDSIGERIQIERYTSDSIRERIQIHGQYRKEDIDTRTA